MEELVLVWSKFGLTDAEKTMIYIDEEVETPKDERNKYYLVGSLWSIRPFSNNASINTMKTLWRPVEGMRSEIVEDNKFLFTLYCGADIDSILERRPWTFDNHIFMVQEISRIEQPRQVIMNSMFFWIRLYDLSIGAMREGVVTRLASQVGKVIQIRKRGDKDLRGRYVRVQVQVDVRIPVIRGLMFSMNDVALPIQVNYERLQPFCFNCGCLGYTHHYCEKPNSKENQFPYGLFIAASPGIPAMREMSGDRSGAGKTRSTGGLNQTQERPIESRKERSMKAATRKVF